MTDSTDPHDLVDRALQLFGDARDSFLDRTCGGETELRAEVDALLSELDRGPTPAGLEPGRGIGELQVGKHLGPYRLLELLGEGGFGSVFLAEQREPVRRRVALKVIKLGMDTRQVIARFEAERQALSMMAHPNIAQVLDVGSTETGRPYFVMELVRGVSITDYCLKQALDVEARLELFLSVCHALQHAHQKGVIHRDVKPSNVLVSVESGPPMVKVIDFGIAKATHQDLTDKTLVTLQQQLIGTPTYMPPEQAELSGLDVDTRSDIYALGVLLYELLVNTTPFDARELASAGRTEMLRVIREVDPQRPSARAAEDDPELARRLQGDLDWIVMRCLEKDLTRRYETANELAADVRRHLDDEPVSAGPPSTLYRVGKFVRRNRTGVTTAAAGLVLLMVAVIGTTWGWLAAVDARADAQAAAEAESAARREAQASAEAATREALRAEAEAARATAATRRAEQEALVAEAAHAMSQRRASELERVVGLHESQLARLDGEGLGIHLRDTLVALAHARAALDEPTPAAAAQLADFEARLEGLDFTDLALGVVIDSVLDPTLRAVDEEFGDHPLVRADMLQAVSDAFVSMDRHDRAEVPQRAAYETRLAELGPEHRDTLAAQHALGTVLDGQGRLDESWALLERCHAARVRALGVEDRDTLDTLTSMAVSLQQQGRLDEARAMHEQAYDVQARAFGPDDPDALENASLLSQTYYLLGEWTLAEETSQRALEGWRRQPDDRRKEIWDASNTLGLAVKVQGNVGAAETLLREVHESTRTQLGERHHRSLKAAMNLGSLLVEEGRFEEAEALLVPVVAHNRTRFGSGHVHTLESLMQLALLRFEQGQHETSDELMERAWHGMARFHDDEAHHNALDIGALLAENRLATGQLERAEPVAVELMHLAGRGLDAADLRTRRARRNVTRLLRDLDGSFPGPGGGADETLAWIARAAAASNALSQFDDARGLLEFGLQRADGATGVPAWRLAEARSLLGEAHAGLGDEERAQGLLLAAFNSLEPHQADESERTRLRRAARRLQRFYEDSGRREAAASWAQRVRDLRPRT